MTKVTKTTITSESIITADGLVRLKEKHTELTMTTHPKVLAKVKEALEDSMVEGENEVYQAANDERLNVERKIAKLKLAIKNAVVIEVPETTTGIVSVGSTVIVELNGDSDTFFVVGSLEANPMEGRISHESPLGQALLGRKIGDSVEFELPEDNGLVIYRIVGVK